MKDLVFQTLWIRYSIPLGEQLSLTTTSEYYFMDPAIDRLLAEQLQGKEQHKISINKRGNSLQLRFVGWTDHNLTLGNTISLTVNGCAATLEDLETLLYSSVPTLRRGLWIRGDDCRATILKCESQVCEAHPTTGQGRQFKEGGSRYKEMHYTTGPCTLTFRWDSKVGPPITIVAASSYAKFMWNPL